MRLRLALRISCLVLPLAAWMTAFATIAGQEAAKPETLNAGKSARGPREDSESASGAGRARGGGVAASTKQRRQEAQHFVGAAKCGECHEGIHRKWAGARHSKMIQPATPQSVLGDFSRGAITLRGT